MFYSFSFILCLFILPHTDSVYVCGCGSLIFEGVKIIKRINVMSFLSHKELVVCSFQLYDYICFVTS